MKKNPRTYNERLAPLPSDDEILAAIPRLIADDPRWRNREGVSANGLAERLGVEPSRRLGRGAVKGSWSGRMAPGLRLAPRLGSLVRRGLLVKWTEDHRTYYDLS